MMTVAQTIPDVQLEALEPILQTFLKETADALARETHFVQRVSPLTGAIFAQTLILGWLAQPEASYTHLQQLMALRGCKVSSQALEQRMTEKAADFLLCMLHALITEALSVQDVENTLLERFKGVYLQDGSIISLPNSLEGIYQGCGGGTKESGKSGMRMQIRLNMSSGHMQGPWLGEERACEQKGAASFQEHPLPPGSLLLTDSAYLPMHMMKQQTTQGVWWETHARANLIVRDAHGVRYTIKEYLRKHEQERVIDEWVTIGDTNTTRQQVRFLAFRVSERTEQRRRAQANKPSAARGKGSRRVQVGKKGGRPSKDGHHRHHPSKQRLELSQWTILLTNVPASLLAPHEARALMRCRWQIELVWRLWKERGQVDIWRSEKDMRILCEIYAKLMGMVLQQWFIIVGCWQHPDRSIVKASFVVTALATTLALTLDGPVFMQDVLLAGKRAMSRARLNTYQKRPSTASLLKHPELAGGLG
jgi:hypothetical protein